MSESYRRKRSQVVVACNSCRKKKIKCDGKRPNCQACLSKTADCIYEADADATPIVALKRKFDQLEKEYLLHDRLIHSLRSASDANSIRILSRLRETNDIGAVLDDTSTIEQSQPSIRDGQTRPRSPSVDSISRASRQVLSDQPLWVNDTTAGPSRNAHPAGIGSSTDSSLSDLSLSSNSQSRSRGRQPTVLHPLIVQTPRSLSQPPWSLGTGNNSPPPSDSYATFTAARVSDPSFALRPGLPSSTTAARSPYDIDGHDLSLLNARNWGITYVSNEELIDVLSYYFAWDHLRFQVFDSHVFLDDLVDGGSTYCSKALLHAIIAIGVRNYNILNGNASALIGHFALVQAKSIFDFESDQDSPANAAAGFLLHHLLCMDGLDKSAHKYLAQAMFIARNLGLFDCRNHDQLYSSSNSKRNRANQVLAWGIYGQQSYASTVFHQSPMQIEPPPTPIPTIELAVDAETWAPYPSREPSQPALQHSAFIAKSCLHAAAIGIMPLWKRHEKDRFSGTSLRETLEQLEKIEACQANLDSRLELADDSPPHIVLLHLAYYQYIIVLLRPLAEPPKDGPWSDDESDGRCPERVLRSFAAAHTKIRQILDQYSNSWGKHHPIPAGFASPISVLSSGMLRILENDPADVDAQFSFDLCMRMYRRMAEPFIIVRFIMLATQKFALRRRIDLSDESKRLFAEVMTLQSTIPGAETVRSAFPVDLKKAITDPDEAKLEYVLEMTSSLSIDESL